MGSSEFSLAALKRLYENGFNIVAVYTKVPKPTGRNYKVTKTVIHEYAEQKHIPVYTPRTLRNSPEQEELFVSLKADVVVVAAYGLIIPENFLGKSIFINIHGSLLPRWRGAAPIQAAIMAGDEETGISIMKVDAGLDTGDIISMKSLKIGDMTSGELFKAMADLGAEMIEETLLNLDDALKNAVPQPEEGVTYADKISKDICKIDWNEDRKSILCKIKALSPTPGAWTELNGLRIKILNASLVDPDENIDKDFVMKCSDGLLRLDVVQPAGKNAMSGRDFARGHRIV